MNKLFDGDFITENFEMCGIKTPVTAFYIHKQSAAVVFRL